MMANRKHNWRRSGVGRIIAVYVAAVCIVVLAGCAPAPVPFTPLQGETAESQWELHLVDGDNDTPLTVAVAVSQAKPEDGRLFVMLPFGQLIGKCMLTGGKAGCEPAVPGVGGLLQSVAAPMARMVQADAGTPGGSLFAGAGAVRQLQGRGWRCAPEGEWLVYREERSKWTLRLKRIK